MTQDRLELDEARKSVLRESRALLRGKERRAQGRFLVEGRQAVREALRELESDGLVERTVFAVVPPRVDYCLTPRGRSLEPVIMAMKRWGDENIPLKTAA